MAKQTKAPKHYVCTECGFVSDRTKSIKLPGVTFAVCFKCRGRLQENPEWTKWLHTERERIRQAAIENNNGYIMGVKIN
ncbi:hypothetical protein M5X06_28400 [Paenibacillus alvei]|uniref:Uncharacterized protein n=1 Tax=Paenibacillus alvei TaxID=44250 RepID=A0ABT4H754_PAEAL|nr:hypothetical protein [Paenibacillus alvei]MCY9764795.1 hypothetical protein [Paenibacillus alvei]MCY9770702.1 hypothetical protein [Paenibacillus alvei]